jgi:hypothetical protein
MDISRDTLDMLILPTCAVGVVTSILLMYWMRERAWRTVAQRYGLMRSIQADTLLGRIIEAPYVTGEYEGGSLVLTTESRGSGRSRSVYTVLRFYPGCFSGGLSLSREGLGRKLVKALGREEEQLGIEDFDKRVFIEGVSESDRRLLADPGVQRALLALFRAFPSAFYKHGTLQVERYGHVGTVRTLEGMLKRAGAVSAALRAVGSAQRVA